MCEVSSPMPQVSAVNKVSGIKRCRDEEEVQSGADAARTLYAKRLCFETTPPSDISSVCQNNIANPFSPPAPPNTTVTGVGRLNSQLYMSEYRKSEELMALRREGEKVMVERNEALSQVGRLEHENRILKRAVVIQNNRSEEIQQVVNQLKAALEAANQQNRRLEQANYGLLLHLQRTTQTSGPDGNPPDVC